MIKRVLMTDYLYAVVPSNLYPWVIKKLDQYIGLIFYIGGDLHIFRKAGFIGNGLRILNLIHNSNRT